MQNELRYYIAPVGMSEKNSFECCWLLHSGAIRRPESIRALYRTNSPDCTEPRGSSVGVRTLDTHQSSLYSQDTITLTGRGLLLSA